MKSVPYPILDINHLTVEYPSGSFNPFHRKRKTAVTDITIQIQTGECFAVFGESGCGKSSLINAILAFAPVTQGTILFDNQNLLHLYASNPRRVRPLIQPVFQNFHQALNPRRRIGSLFKEIHSIYPGRPDPAVLFQRVGLSRAVLNAYPHQLSGGQQQRIGIARALATNPKLLLLDEPVTSLDLSVAARILVLLKALQKDQGLTYLLVSHNFAILRLLADRIAVMQNGRILEIGSPEQLITNPKHDYTKNILAQSSIVC